jgi:hypothetical protein
MAARRRGVTKSQIMAVKAAEIAATSKIRKLRRNLSPSALVLLILVSSQILMGYLG